MSERRVIAVTGGSGFTGQFVVREARRRYPEAAIRCLIRSPESAALFEPLGVDTVIGDLRVSASLNQLFEGADTLLNVASLGFDWVDSLMDAIGRAPHLRRGVFVSTTAILTGLPVQSKPRRLHGERRVRESHLAWTLLRPTMIYGTPGDRNVIRLIRMVDRLPVIPLVAPRALQQPVHVEDVASAVVAVVDVAATIGQTYEISGASPIPLRAMVEQTAAALGRRRVTVPLPLGGIRQAVRLYNRLSRRPRVTVEQVDRINEDKAFAHTAAHRAFGYSPRSFAVGVAQEVALYRSQRSRSA